jgi:hypothetical protein
MMGNNKPGVLEQTASIDVAGTTPPLAETSSPPLSPYLLPLGPLPFLPSSELAGGEKG